MIASLEKWKNKIAVVTGASSGIGAATTLALLKEGIIVVGLARRKNKILQLSNSSNLHAVKVDMSKEEDIVNAFKWIRENVGAIHILINNAGLANVTTLIDGKTELWKEVFDVNVMGLCIATREAVKIMQKDQVDGHIIHMNSIAGHYVPNLPNFNVLAASKHAVTALTETLRQELISINSKMKVTSISPGVVKTNAVETAVSESQSSKAADEFHSMMQNLPFIKAEDVADAIIYVLSTPAHVQVHELKIRAVGEPF